MSDSHKEIFVMSQIKKLIVRVYGVCVNAEREILIVDEVHHGKGITKFPGGGMELGEGTIDCLKREFMEETGRPIEVLSHFYTTDFFVNSYFDFEAQVLSIYYKVAFTDADSTEKDIISQDPELSFRWLSVGALTPDLFTFIIDKTVAEQIRCELQW
jgi:8-oxo-dGTP diphosphatase